MADRKALEVYLDLSQPCRAIQFHTRTPQYTKLNPMQMVDNYLRGKILDSRDAILKYLPRKYNVPSNWYPCHLERRARVDEYTAWHHTNTTTCGQGLYHGGKTWVTLEKLENMFLKRQPFLCGDDISLADLLVVCELMQVRSSGVRDILKDRPKLLSWKSRVQSALGDSFDKAHTVLYRLWDRSNAKL
uniref:Glutathione S-transferase theta 2 n=1 Tax=Hucho hucho TaxID=62062 RepID=A0A4W5Q550_9TELE